jgi:hypothetical protein
VVSKDDALAHPIAHPNCRRSYGARPDITTAGAAEAATPSVTPSQIDAQRAADSERSRLAEARKFRQRARRAPSPAQKRRNASSSLAAARRGDAKVPVRKRPRR